MPQEEANLTFTGNGTVSAVNVQPGQHVTAGTVLARLNSTTLASSVSQAQAALATAQAKLAQDEAGGSPTAIAAAQAQVQTATTGLANAQTSFADVKQVNAQTLAQAQSAVTVAQDALTSAQQSHASASQLTSDNNALTAAQNNLAVTQARNQQTIDAAQAQVNSATTQLANAQAQLASSQAPAPAAQLNADRAAVAAAQQALQVAETNLAGATLTAPYAGIVAAVNVTTGETVGAGGSGASAGGGASGASASSGAAAPAIVVIGNGGYEVQTTVSDAQIGQIKDGEQAVITPDGVRAPVYGTVAQIVPQATTSGGVAVFPIVINVTGHPGGLFAGASATVSLLVHQVSNVLTIPTSAIHTVGARNFVLVWQPDGKPIVKIVKVGLADAQRTQIVSGLTIHDRVILANLRAPLPSNTGFGAGRGFGGFGGFGGGGFGGGGFRGGGSFGGRGGTP